MYVGIIIIPCLEEKRIQQQEEREESVCKDWPTPFPLQTPPHHLPQIHSHECCFFTWLQSKRLNSRQLAILYFYIFILYYIYYIVLYLQGILYLYIFFFGSFVLLPFKIYIEIEFDIHQFFFIIVWHPLLTKVLIFLFNCLIN